MKKTPTPTQDPNMLAITQRAGNAWRVLIANVAGPMPHVIGSREFPVDLVARFDGWLNEHKVASVLCVVPSAAVICRNCPLPDASAEQLEQALHLQAEANLLGIAPPHRLAMAVLPNAAGETTRTGLVLAWPEAAAFNGPPTTRPMTYVPDVAALAALLNGQRPTEAMLWMDRDDGSVAMAITHAGGASFRATREEAQSTEAWQRSIGRLVAETGLSVGHTGPFIDALVQDAHAKAGMVASREARLFMPAEVLASAASRIKGVQSDPSWWSQYGITAGALLARAGSTAALTRMLHTPPVEAPSPMRTILEKLSRPQAAAVALALCVLALLFAPLVFNGMRLLILSVRFNDLDQQIEAASTSKQQLAMYRELEKQSTWPMTKLLADITANTPIGIELESIRIEGGKDFVVAGTALSSDGRSPAALVALMQENLGRDGMFSDIAVNSGKIDNLGRYKFDLSAKITRPYFAPNRDDDRDFKKNSYALRLYGPPPDDSIAIGAVDSRVDSAPAPVEAEVQPVENERLAAVDDEQEIPPDLRSSTTPTRFDGGIGVDPSTATSGGMSVDPRAVPPPLDVEQIKVMSKAELKDALAKVSRARINRDLPKDVQARLKQEHDQIMEYLRKAKN